MSIEVNIERNANFMVVTIKLWCFSISGDNTPCTITIYFLVGSDFIINIVDDFDNLICEVVGNYSWELPVTNQQNRRRARVPSPPNSPLSDRRKRFKPNETSGKNNGISTTLHDDEYYRVFINIHSTHIENNSIRHSSPIEGNNQSLVSYSSSTLTADISANVSSNNSSNDVVPGSFTRLIRSLDQNIEEEDYSHPNSH